MLRSLCTLIVIATALTGCGEIIDAGQKISNRGDDKTEWWSELPRESWSRFPLMTQGQPWFEVYQVKPHVLAIYEPGQFEEVISYLVLGSERALLIDTGLGVGNLRELVDSLTDLPVAVINTHTHYDHVGGNYQFEKIYGRATAYTRKNAEGHNHDYMGEFVGPGWIWKTTPPGFDASTFVARPFTITDELQDGQLIDLGDRQLEVLFVNGHTPDSLCVFDRQSGVLFTGDIFYLAPLYTHLEDGDFAMFREAIQTLAQLPGVTTLMPGHNEAGVSGDYLQRARIAFDKVAADEHPFELTDNNREYDFGDFSIITRDEQPEVIRASN